MNTFKDEINRQLIPRWLPYRTACALIPADVHDYAVFRSALDQEGLLIKKQAWEETRATEFAIDLVSSALMAQQTDDGIVQSAAEFLSNSKHDEIAPSIRKISDLIASGTSSPVQGSLENVVIHKAHIAGEISRLKMAIQERAPDPFLYSDLAYYYSLLAQNDAAKNAMRIGLALADGNPLFLRSAARFLLHVTKDADESLSLLRRSEATKHDPTLMAAEISISEAFDRPSKLKSRAKRLIQEDRHHAFHMSELAGAVATFEMREGSNKRARRAFSKALECPTENTLAQASWAARFLPEAALEEAICSRDYAFEAEARDHFWAEDFEKALSFGEDWAAFQPFSSRPSVFATLVAGVSIEDHGRAIKIAEQSLVASPNDFTLRNNLAFSLALAGNTDQALLEISRAERASGNQDEDAVASATRGLIAFRNDDLISGREGYLSAIRHFSMSGDGFKAACARIFYAREEKLAASDLYPEARRVALRDAKRLHLFGMAALAEILDDDCQAIPSGDA